jgi:hypothetical protein
MDEKDKKIQQLERELSINKLAEKSGADRELLSSLLPQDLPTVDNQGNILSDNNEPQSLKDYIRKDSTLSKLEGSIFPQSEQSSASSSESPRGLTSSGVPKAKGEPPKPSKSPTKSTVEANEERARQQVLKRFGYV